MIGSAIAQVILPVAVALGALLLVFLAYIGLRYSPIIGRIFEETPVFAPLRGQPEPGEEVRFRSEDGLELAGTYLRALSRRRLGVIVLCPEYLGDRWSALSYGDGLRESGFDLFAFDFRNHGESEVDPDYRPLQWVSDLEVADLRAALAYVRSRSDADPAGVGLFGISRGGGTALCEAASDPTVWAVATDGAFPTRGTMLAYVTRWAEIYLPFPRMAKYMPRFTYAFAGWAGRVTTERRLGRRYPSLERAVGRLAPRPWLMIHGERDAYIGPEIARELFAYADGPKEAWIVPGAKHNRCREANPREYLDRLAGFFKRHAPRASVAAVLEPEPVIERSRAVSGTLRPVAVARVTG